jgi:biotin transport system substrate-specific component
MSSSKISVFLINFFIFFKIQGDFDSSRQIYMKIKVTAAMDPSLLSIKTTNSFLLNALLIASGVLVLGLLAQIKFFVPWTPVPITGQTLGVYFIALMWGSKRALTCFAFYLALGFWGLPLFALGASGVSFGYLFGMLVATWLTGKLYEESSSRSFKDAFFASFLGTASIFVFGLWGLSFYVETSMLLSLGLYPFILFELLKIFIASTAAANLHKKL